MIDRVTVNQKRFNFAQQCVERWNHAEAMRMFESTNPYAAVCVMEVFACLVCVEYECYQQLGRTDDEVMAIVDEGFKTALFQLRNFWFHPQDDIEPRLRRWHLDTPNGFARCMKLHEALGRVFKEECIAAGGTPTSWKEFVAGAD